MNTLSSFSVLSVATGLILNLFVTAPVFAHGGGGGGHSGGGGSRGSYASSAASVASSSHSNNSSATAAESHNSSHINNSSSSAAANNNPGPSINSYTASSANVSSTVKATSGNFFLSHSPPLHASHETIFSHGNGSASTYGGVWNREYWPVAPIAYLGSQSQLAVGTANSISGSAYPANSNYSADSNTADSNYPPDSTSEPSSTPSGSASPIQAELNFWQRNETPLEGPFDHPGLSAENGYNSGAGASTLGPATNIEEPIGAVLCRLEDKLISLHCEDRIGSFDIDTFSNELLSVKRDYNAMLGDKPRLSAKQYTALRSELSSLSQEIEKRIFGSM